MALAVPHHVARPRLVDRLAGAPVGLVEAPGGYGKSALATEARAAHEGAAAEVLPERLGDDAGTLVTALRRAFRRAGLGELPAGLADEAPDVVARMLAGADGPVLLVVDEAQRLTGTAAALLAALARELPAGHRLLVLGRRVDERLRRLDAVRLDADDLAFDRDEVASLLAAALGRVPTRAEVGDVRRVTFGWPAATVLAATRLARAPGRPLPRGPGSAAIVGRLLDELLEPLADEPREALARLGYLPLLSARVAERCSGAGALERLRDAGLPLQPAAPGWLELPDPVREDLRRRAARPPPVIARSVAADYADAGELPAALALLISAEDHDGVAQLLAARHWTELAALEPAELRALLLALPDGAVRTAPSALVQVARATERGLDLAVREELLRRAVDLLDDGPARREARAELAALLAITEPHGAAEALAQGVLAEAPAGERVARARALTALGHLEAWRADAVSLLAAERHYGEAAALHRLTGEREWQAATDVACGYRVTFLRGDLDRAIDHLAAALAPLADGSGDRGMLAIYLADVLVYAGRLGEADALLREAHETARRLGDHRMQAYASWAGATLASLAGDAGATIERIRHAEAFGGDWFEHPTGAEFLAEAACAMARLGDERLAAELTARAEQRAAGVGHPEIAWIAVGAYEARYGDPERADRVLRDYAASPQQAPRDEWRTLLLRAYAARRRGDPAAERLAAQAREAAALLGHPGLPALHEPDVAQALGLVAPAAETEAVAAHASGARPELTVLGGFALRVDGDRADPPAGRPALLVKLLALADGPVRLDEVIECLWPGAELDVGRRRVRNLLGRLHAACGPLVVRVGDTLRLAPEVGVDAARFEAAAAAALGTGADGAARAERARAALALFGGDVLPGDVYEPWSIAPRERVRRSALAVLDLLAEDAVDRGELDEAVRLLDRAAELEPLDESRLLRAAELLLVQGRRGSARAWVRRAVALRERLEQPESPRVARLRQATGA